MRELRREKHKGFHTYEDAYDWVMENVDGNYLYYKFNSLRHPVRKEIHFFNEQ